MLDKKIKYLLLFAVIWLLPNVVHAQCSYERVAELSRMASNVQLSYSYDFKDHNPIFRVTATNLTNDIYMTTSGNIPDENGQAPWSFTGTGEKNIYFADGAYATFQFYSNDRNCLGEELLTSYINLPLYNSYSTTDECQKHPYFKYCKMWSGDNAVETSKFTNEYNEYKNLVETAQENEKNKKQSFLDILTNSLPFSNLYIWIVVGMLIILLVVFVNLTAKRRRRF